MISNKKVLKQLSLHYYEQLRLAEAYHQYAFKANMAGMEFLSEYFMHLADDKLGPHAKRLLKYLTQTNYDFSMHKVEVNFNFEESNSMSKIVNITHDYEKDVRLFINNTALMCIDEKDFESFDFIQWFVHDGFKDFGEIDTIKTVFDQCADKIPLVQIDNILKQKINLE